MVARTVLLIPFIQNILFMISVNLFRLAQGRMQVGVLLISSVLANLQKDEEYRYKTKWMTEGALVIHQFHDCCAQKSRNEVRFLGLFDFLKGKWRHSEDRYRAVKNAMTQKYVACNLAADFYEKLRVSFRALSGRKKDFSSAGNRHRRVSAGTEHLWKLSENGGKAVFRRCTVCRRRPVYEGLF